MTKQASIEILNVLAHVGSIYRKPEGLSYSRITNPQKTLMTASRNRVLYHFMTTALACGALDDNEELACLRLIGKREIDKFYHTLDFLNTTLGQDGYIMLKTYKGYTYVTWDVDILVDDVENTVKQMIKEGFEIQRGEPAKPSCHRQDLLVIGLHPKASWHSGKLMDNELQWSQPRKVNYEGIEVFIPNYEVDFLTFVAHTNFENYHFTIGDLLYLYKLAGSVDWEIVLKQVTKYGWTKSFKQTISIANGLHRSLYSNQPSPMENIVPSVLDVTPRMPFLYRHHHIISFHRELGIAPRDLMWELFFYTYRLWRIYTNHKLCYIDSFLYAPLGDYNYEKD